MVDKRPWVYVRRPLHLTVHTIQPAAAGGNTRRHACFAPSAGCAWDERFAAPSDSGNNPCAAGRRTASSSRTMAAAFLRRMPGRTLLDTVRFALRRKPGKVLLGTVRFAGLLLETPGAIPARPCEAVRSGCGEGGSVARLSLPAHTTRRGARGRLAATGRHALYIQLLPRIIGAPFTR